MALSGRRLQETVRQTIKTQCKFQARSRCLSITRPNSSSEHHTRPKFDAETAFKLTQPPFPGWKVGTGLDDTETRWGEEGKESRKTWSLSDLSSRETYRFLTSAIVPRPIAFVSSLSADGIPNLAPFSYFSLVSHNPPLVSISFSLPSKRPKDTRENILETKEFTVSIISEPFVNAANATALNSPADVNEWLVSGLTQEPSTDVRPAFVKESAVSFECELYSSQDIPANSAEITTTLVLGLIKRVHVRNSVLQPDGVQVDPTKLRPVARMGGTQYARVLEGFELDGLSWKATSQKYQDILQRKRTGTGAP